MTDKKEIKRIAQVNLDIICAEHDEDDCSNSGHEGIWGCVYAVGNKCCSHLTIKENPKGKTYFLACKYISPKPKKLDCQPGIRCLADKNGKYSPCFNLFFLDNIKTLKEADEKRAEDINFYENHLRKLLEETEEKAKKDKDRYSTSLELCKTMYKYYRELKEGLK